MSKMIGIADIVRSSLRTRLYTAEQEEKVNQLMSAREYSLKDLYSLKVLINALAEGYVMSC